MSGEERKDLFFYDSALDIISGLEIAASIGLNPKPQRNKEGNMAELLVFHSGNPS